MTPELTARLLALPSLRRQAEAEARELFDRGHAVAQSFGFESPMWELLREDERTAVIENHARGLADLTRWQSQAWALRRIAELLWSVPTCTLEHDGETWIIRRDRFCFIRFSPTGWHAGEFHSAVSGIYADTPRAEVLAAILLHVEEA